LGHVPAGPGVAGVVHLVRDRSTPLAVTAPAWLLCSATGSAVMLTGGRQRWLRPAAYFRLARIRQSQTALSLVALCFSARCLRIRLVAYAKPEQATNGPAITIVSLALATEKSSLSVISAGSQQGLVE
jgi:hypothetical protein